MTSILWPAGYMRSDKQIDPEKTGINYFENPF